MAVGPQREWLENSPFSRATRRLTGGVRSIVLSLRKRRHPCVGWRPVAARRRRNSLFVARAVTALVVIVFECIALHVDIESAYGTWPG